MRTSICLAIALFSGSLAFASCGVRSDGGTDAETSPDAATDAGTDAETSPDAATDAGSDDGGGVRACTGLPPVPGRTLACVGPNGMPLDPNNPATLAQSFDWQGKKRSYILCTPNPLPSGPLEVVLGFHGGSGNAGGWWKSTGWKDLAGPAGFVMVYLQGCQDGLLDCSDLTKGSYSWNIGKLGDARMTDDQSYVMEVVRRLSTVHKLELDNGCRFGTGHSLGAIFLYSLTCDHPELFAAIAPVSASPTDATCAPFGATSIFHVHGKADPVIPFDTGCCSAAQKDASSPEYLSGCAPLPTCYQPATWWPPARSGVHPYATVTGLDAIATAGLGCGADWQEISRSGATTCSEYPSCTGGRAAQVCLIDGVDHSLATQAATFGVNGLDLWHFFWSRFQNTPAR